MTVYHLHWRGTPDGIQTGWYILDTHLREYGRIEWPPSGQMRVVHNDGSLFRACTTHAETFTAASDLITFYHDLDLENAQAVDFPT